MDRVLFFAEQEEFGTQLVPSNKLVTPQSLRLPEKEIGHVSKSFLPGSFAFGGINTHFWTYPNQVVGYLSHLYPTYISSFWLVLIPHYQTALQLIGNILIYRHNYWSISRLLVIIVPHHLKLQELTILYNISIRSGVVIILLREVHITLFLES